jgi:hypothetical protein
VRIGTLQASKLGLASLNSIDSQETLQKFPHHSVLPLSVSLFSREVCGAPIARVARRSSGPLRTLVSLNVYAVIAVIAVIAVVAVVAVISYYYLDAFKNNDAAMSFASGTSITGWCGRGAAVEKIIGY